MNLAHYAKTWGPLVVALVVCLLTFTRDNTFSGPAGALLPLLQLLVAFGTVLITYRAGNAESGVLRYAKLIANVLVTGVQALLLVLLAGKPIETLTLQDWSVVILAAFGALTVWLFPNEPALVAIGAVEDGTVTKLYATDGSSPVETPDLGALAPDDAADPLLA